jgi:hypothetical protein
MIRGISLFITILFLAASADGFELRLHEVAPTFGMPLDYEMQNTIFEFRKFTRFDFTNTRLIDDVAARVPASTYDPAFDFDTVHACTFLLPEGSPCDPDFHTWYEFGGKYGAGSPEESSFYDESLPDNQQGRTPNGIKVGFGHTLEADTLIESKGILVFYVRGEDVTYSLDAFYEILGGQEDIESFSIWVELLELRLTHPEAEGSNQYSWVPLVAERKYLGTTRRDDGVWVDLNASNVGYTLGESPECPRCDGGVNRYTGILKRVTPYKLAYSVNAGRNTEAANIVFPEGSVNLVVPEPSSNLMAFAGILGVVFLARRRNRAKVS